MNEEDRKIITRNKLAMRRLSLIENYMGTMTSINRMMSDLCLNLAKAKLSRSLTFNPTSTTINLEPSLRIIAEHENVSIVDDESAPVARFRPEDSAIAEGCCDEVTKKVDVFRPFGYLEPQSAKLARETSYKLIIQIFDATNTRSELVEIERQICKHNTI